MDLTDTPRAFASSDSPAGQEEGWHSYINIRFKHSESGPQGWGSDLLQMHRGISLRSAVYTCTLPHGLFTCGPSALLRRNSNKHKPPTVIITQLFDT